MNATEDVPIVDAQEFKDLDYDRQWPLSDGNPLADFCCTFQAPKRVVIGRPQGRLAGFAGFLYWTLFIMIFIVYLCWSSIIVGNNHLKYEAPMGSPRIALRRPTIFVPEFGHRCSPQNRSCVNNFTDVTTLPYCLRCTDGPECEYPGEKEECRIWDEDSVVARNLGKDMVFATHIREWEQTRICEGRESHHTCPKTFKSEERAAYYLADIDNFVLTISHSMRTPAIITEVDMKMHGEGLEACPHPVKHQPSPQDERDEAERDDGDDDEREERTHRRLQDDGHGAHDSEHHHSGHHHGNGHHHGDSDSHSGHDHDDAGSRSDSGHEANSTNSTNSSAQAHLRHARRHVNRFRNMVNAAMAEPECNHIMPDRTLSTFTDSHADSFHLGTVLEAAGVHLDEASPAQNASAGQTRRNLGTTLILTIHYANTKPYESFYKAYVGDLPIRYHYTLTEMPVREYKLRDSYWTGEWNGPDRTVVEAHGIHLQIMFSGELGTWSWAQFMVLLSVSMTTVFMAEKIVVLFIRKFPLPSSISKPKGGVSQSMLADNMVEYYKLIDESWKDLKNEKVSAARQRNPKPDPAE